MFSAFGLDMLGKLSTNLSDTYGTGNTLRDAQREENMDDYLTRERMGIQARAEGAKAAGLHPLVGMGYQGGNSPTSVIGASEAPRSHAPVPNREERDPNIDRYNAARARLAEAEATKAERDLAHSQRALAGQPGQPSPVASLSLTSAHNIAPGPGFRLKPGVKLKEDEVTMGAGGSTAGTHPGMTEYEMPWGARWSLPSAGLSQALEDLELAKYLAIFKANSSRVSDAIKESFVDRSAYERRREIDSLRRRYPPRGIPGKWPPRMHGGRVY